MVRYTLIRPKRETKKGARTNVSSHSSREMHGSINHRDHTSHPSQGSESTTAGAPLEMYSEPYWAGISTQVEFWTGAALIAIPKHKM